ncbi:hypothetical protein QFC22_004081 [Naganishia vaughanmartiniae]|uniref:Uncharacterized protein n=1 Tax=Naganishia vaughanmartiniae TaxID=1424756 RepID=A0ACC2X2Q9_9TREE|nr:hypothetical protein QFC22_004081 [Naganishia vaughanmartiniae]
MRFSLVAALLAFTPLLSLSQALDSAGQYTASQVGTLQSFPTANVGYSTVQSAYPTILDVSLSVATSATSTRSTLPDVESPGSSISADQTVSATYNPYPQEGGYRGEGVYGKATQPAYAATRNKVKLLQPAVNRPTRPGESTPISADIYRHRAQSAVNLGFWLVGERWGTPEYYAGCATDDNAEFNVAEGCSKEYMENFWSTFITENDFAAMPELGINTVRIPIGYWTVGKAHCHCEKTVFWPYMDKYENQWSYVLKAIEWAAKYNIGVLIDFHGAEGSQNGWEHSGVHSQQPLFLTKIEYMLHTTAVLQWVAAQIKDFPNIVGLQLLNEPYPDKQDVINPWYETTLRRLKPILGNDFPFYVFGNNKPRSDWLRNRTEFLVMDYHLYFLWNPEIEKLNTDQLIDRMHSYYGPLLDSWGPNLIIGEWACTVSNPDTPWINYTQFCDAQMELLNRPSIAGWHYWNWKAEGDWYNTWSFLSSTGGADGLSRAHTDTRELLIPPRGQDNFLIDLSVSTGPAQGKTLRKRSLFAIEEPNALHIWDEGCKVAGEFARAGSRYVSETGWALQINGSRARDCGATPIAPMSIIDIFAVE